MYTNSVCLEGAPTWGVRGESGCGLWVGVWGGRLLEVSVCGGDRWGEIFVAHILDRRRRLSPPTGYYYNTTVFP